ncbi:MAG: sigma-70 family RNA polymerase sigma factor [Bacteroidales bacterium]|nr:sigma-70 family RNA polymerase sigma factor [Bacteroidales bacterium]
MNKDNFISVVKDNQNLIFKICNSYCSNYEDRKDLQQDILIQLWNSFSKFDGRVKISTWIYRIALNTAISFYRKDRKRNEKTVGIDASVISLPDSRPGFELDERISLLYKYLERLNEMDKALILLVLEDKSYRDMAEILGISETNVATKISRIKKRIKEEFKH